MAGLRTFGRYAPLLLIAVAFLPVLLSAVPGLSDYPNHVGRHHGLAVVGKGGPLDAFFTVHWRWIGNLGVDLPVLALAPWLGAERATWVVAACMAPLTVAGILALGRAAHGRLTAATCIALPLALSQPYMYGFLNYSLGIALALLVAAHWLRKPPSGPLALLGFAMAATLVYTAHTAAWVVLVLIAGGMALCRWRSGERPMPLFLGLVSLAVPLLCLLLWRSGGNAPAFAFETRGILQTKLMAFATVLKGTWKPVDLALEAALFTSAIAALILAPRGARLHRPLLCAGLLLVLGVLAVPTTVMGSWGADMRVAPVAVLVLLLAIAPAVDPKQERALIAIGILLFVVRVGTVTVDWARQSAVLEKRLTLLDTVPAGARLGYIALAPDCRAPWHLDPTRKLAGLAVARRDVFTNSLFQIDGADILVIRDAHLRSAWHDGSQDVPADCGVAGRQKALLGEKLRAMASDGFGPIWLSGAREDAVPLPAGYRIAARAEGDLLLVRFSDPR